jgi:Tfp pilus assembly protein PilF
MESLRPTYDALRDRGYAVLQSGDYLGAHRLFAEAVDVARQLADPELFDRAVCNRAALAIEIDGGASELQALREVLLAQRSPAAAFLAAYNLAEAYQLSRQHRKAAFYAEIALDRAQRAQRPDWVASSHNRLGNLHVALNQLGLARQRYEAALGLVAADDLRVPAITENLGYVDALEGDLTNALTRLYRALRLLRRRGTTTALIHLDIAWTTLQAGRADLAWKHAALAREKALASHDHEQVKNALMLGIQASRALGDRVSAAMLGEALASSYPEQAGLASLFGAADWACVLNLRA